MNTKFERDLESIRRQAYDNSQGSYMKEVKHAVSRVLNDALTDIFHTAMKERPWEVMGWLNEQVVSMEWRSGRQITGRDYQDVCVRVLTDKLPSPRRETYTYLVVHLLSEVGFDRGQDSPPLSALNTDWVGSTCASIHAHAKRYGDPRKPER